MRKRAIYRWRLWLWALVGILMSISIIGRPGPVVASDKLEAQSIVVKSRGTLTDLTNDENFSWLHTYLKSAKGVLIFPQILKAGFFLGGSGGTGVLLVRNEATGTWSDPAFYTLGSVTFGLQFGGEAAEVVMVALNKKAIDSLLSSSVKLGGDVSIAIGPIGGGVKGAVTVPEVTADFVSFAKSKGFYGGLNLEGSVIQVRDGLNGSYYGREITPKEILARKPVDVSGAAELRSVLEKASVGK
jgi:lipid-binding SYLF domain-containing protein